MMVTFRQSFARDLNWEPSRVRELPAAPSPLMRNALAAGLFDDHGVQMGLGVLGC